MVPSNHIMLLAH